MEYPSLPTDNLYKFLALAGLALAVFSLTYPTHMALEIKLKTIEFQSKYDKMSIEIDELEKEVNALRITKTDEEVGKKLMSQMRSKLIEIKLKQVDIKATAASIEAQRALLNSYQNSSLWGLIFGSLVSAVGFLLWYYRVQKPNDNRRQETQLA